MTQSTHSAPPQATDSPQAHLEVRDASGRTVRMPVDEERTVIGRSDDAPVQLFCESVSRKHAELFRDHLDQWWLRDLGSVNGTRVNGRRVSEVVISPRDVVEIGEFQLRLLTNDAPAGGSDSGTRIVTPDLERATLSDGDDSHISTLGDVVAAKIDVGHLMTLNDFAHELSHIESAQERLEMLCELMVREEFHCRQAIGVRLQRDDPEVSPGLLCAPASSRGGAELPHLSRSLLTIVRKNETPAIALRSPNAAGGTVQMTMISGIEDIAAAACPIRRSADALDVLYVTLPAEYGTGEWLTLIAHASQTYEQIEIAREAQKQAEERGRIEKELSRAKAIQTRFVPGDLAIPGMELAIGFEPCRGVGGDYVDVLKLKDGRTLLAIADVSGKGMPAAMIASTVHSMVHTCQRVGNDLVSMMTALNEHLYEFLGSSEFVTMAAMVLDTETGAFELVNAGHPAPVVAHPDGTFVELQCGANFPLGITPYEVQMEKGVLEKGRLIALFTDGLTELTDEDDQELGPERIARHLCEFYTEDPAHPAHPDRVAERLTKTLDEYLGDRSPGDDRTFLLGRRA